MADPTGRGCTVCGGMVMKEVQEYDPTGKRLYQMSIGYFCGKCGIQYRFPPPKKAEQPSPEAPPSHNISA